MTKRLLPALLLALLLSGCLQPAVRLGCCLRANATDPANPGCVLYNTTNLTATDAYFQKCTGGVTSGCTHECNESKGGCNVSVKVGSTAQDFILPICTQDQIVACISPNCTAMVCGDFAFKPRVAPGMGDTNQSAGTAPSNVEQEGGALQFYNAQCRFLPMDAKLNRIMKNSKSQLNVFRMGVGGSFDEYDQYRYYFPISDKYCGVNSAGRVDRYMNYLTASGGTPAAYNDPVSGITANCVNGTNEPAVLAFHENTAQRTSTSSGRTVTYSPVLPDQNNYKFSHYARFSNWAVQQSATVPVWYGGWDWDYYTYHYYTYDNTTDTPTAQSGVFKKLDDGFYRRALSIAHASSIYGTGGGSTTRAPFECSSSSNDCYSGNCNMQTYTRSVILTSSDPAAAREVVTDCDQFTDGAGIRVVTCAPTKSVTPQTGQPPVRNYGKVSLRLAYIDIRTSDYRSNPREDPPVGASDLQDGTELDNYWMYFGQTATNSTNTIKTTKTWNVTNVTRISWQLGPRPQKQDCSEITQNYNNVQGFDASTGAWQPLYSSSSSATELAWCPQVVEAATGPPLGGITFFGKTGTDGTATVEYNGKTIIGYSLLTPADFNDTLLYKNCHLTPNDYEVVTLSDPRDTKITDATTGLLKAFKPYFEQRVKGLRGQLGTRKVSTNSVVVSFMPWVATYEKGLRKDGTYIVSHNEAKDAVESAPPWGGCNDRVRFMRLGFFLTSPPSQDIRQRNIYDEEMNQMKGTTAGELDAAGDPCGGGEYTNTNVGCGAWCSEQKFVHHTYTLGMSSSIILIRYNGSGMLGSCAIDTNSYLPVVKTFGWCEPCTTSTLAFQNVSTYPKVYLPVSTAKVETPTASGSESICTATLNSYYNSTLGNYIAYDNVTCFNSRISDVQDYKGSPATQGSPRTKPDATILKERLGNYMKSGVLPVLDLSDRSNWNITNPLASLTNYTEYDFKRLFGEMGAAIVIVEHVSSRADAVAKRDNITDRASAVRDYCFGCLTAIHIDAPASNETVYNITNRTFTDPIMDFSIDMVTFDYPVTNITTRPRWSATHPNWSTMDLQQKSNAVVDNIASYGRASLQAKGSKPTMVVGFNVENSDSNWGGNFGALFDALALHQAELVKAGVTGIIYSPARSFSLPLYSGNPIGGKGLVQIYGMTYGIPNPGQKSAKFCAMQGAMEKLSKIPPSAVFNKVMPVAAINCTACDSLEKALGKCGVVCDNGVECTLPGGLAEEDATCPDGAIAGACTLCKDVPGSYTCSISYANGTVQTLHGLMSDVSSDMYLDVVGGISKPQKCCLQDASGFNYSYTKTAYASQQNLPIAFPRSGDPNTDCGFGASVQDINALTSFCGVRQTQVKDYDINCTIGS